MRKGQVTVFIIIGLVIAVASVIFVSSKNRVVTNVVDFSMELGKLESYFRECAKVSMLDANSRYGIHSSTKDDYEKYLVKKIDECMFPFFDELRFRGMDIVMLEEPTASLEINDQNAQLTINYPYKVSTESDSYTFQPFNQEFERITWVDEKNIGYAVSTDASFIFSAPEDIKIYGAYDKPFTQLYIKASDKREIGCEELIGNMAYGIYPLGYYSDEPMKIKFDLEKVAPWLTDTGSLKIAFQDPDSKKCTFIESSKIKDGMLQVDTKYTAFYGVGKPKVQISGYPSQTSGEGKTGSAFNTPAGTFGSFSGEAQEIYNSIQAEMGGTYPLFKNNECVPPGAFCFTGWSASCPNGEAGIYCNDRIYGMSEGDLNTLFRHEITHNLQQNNACAYDTPKSEWGAEYYSGSNYYHFAISGPSGKKESLSAAQVGEELEKAGCVKADLLDGAFCKGGNIGSYTQKCNVEITGYN